MRRLAAEETFRPVPLGDYVDSCIADEHLSTTREDIQIHHVYVTGDERFTHVLCYYGLPDVYLIVVTIHPEDRVYGHRIMNFREEYGLPS